LNNVTTEDEGMKTMEFVGIADLARQLDCRPRDISDAFYNGSLDERRVIRVAGRRAIPGDYLQEVKMVLDRLGKIGKE
jgi:hypothetical protein